MQTRYAYPNPLHPSLPFTATLHLQKGCATLACPRISCPAHAFHFLLARTIHFPSVGPYCCHSYNHSAGTRALHQTLALVVIVFRYCVPDVQYARPKSPPCLPVLITKPLHGNPFVFLFLTPSTQPRKTIPLTAPRHTLSQTFDFNSAGRRLTLSSNSSINNTPRH